VIDLYHWEPTADSLKIIIALKEKSVPFTSRYVDVLNLEHHAEAYRKVADFTRVPLMVEDGEPLKDSQLVLEYLAEGFEPRLAPADPAGWYDVQAWTAQLDQTLGAAVRLLGWHTVTAPAMSENQRKDFLDRSAKLPKPQAAAGWDQVTSDAEASEDQLANAREKIGQGVAKIEAALKDSDWLVGGAYSVVDINAFALTHTLPRLAPDLVNADGTPRMLAWLKRVGERAAVRDALAMARTRTDAYAPMV
jgi:GST-like protein